MLAVPPRSGLYAPQSSVRGLVASQFRSRAVTDWHTLLRFLRAREYDIKKTVTMYMDHLKWRKENDVDNVLETFDFKEREQYLSVYPQGYYNTDREGRPVTIQHLGQVQPKRIMQITTEERMIRFHVQEYERFLKKIAPICSRLAGHHIDQSTTILDVKGARLRTGRSSDRRRRVHYGYAGHHESFTL